MTAHLRFPPKRTVPLGESLVIGRDPTCGLVLDDAAVSRRHALIHRHDGVFWLSDFGSRNGIRLNGQPLRLTTALRHGDVIQMGSVRLTFHTKARPIPPSASTAEEEPVTLHQRDHYAPGQPAVVRLDAQLRVAEYSAAAAAMFRHYFGRCPARALPGAVTDWLAAARGRSRSGVRLNPFVVGSGNRRLIVSACLDEVMHPVLVVQEETTVYAPERLRALGLTEREASVMEWVAQGRTNAEAAAILGISVGTVNKHVESSLKKLGVDNRNQALVLLLDRLGR